MQIKLRHIASLLLVWVLLLPTVIKLEHHHADHPVCHDNKTHFHDHHERCLICVFEFNLYTSLIHVFRIADDVPEADYNSGYTFVCSEGSQPSSLFLRGPPVS